LLSLATPAFVVVHGRATSFSTGGANAFIHTRRHDIAILDDPTNCFYLLEGDMPSSGLLS
jgi:hypothetical protein